MPCKVESPCGGSLRIVDQVGPRTVLSCLNGHHHVVKTPTANAVAQRRYHQTEKFRAAQRRYQKTEKFRVADRRYRQSEKGRAMLARHRARVKARAAAS